MAKHTFYWNKGYEFSSFLPQDKEDFKILEGLEMAKHQVRVALDACDMAAKLRVLNRKGGHSACRPGLPLFSIENKTNTEKFAFLG